MGAPSSQNKNGLPKRNKIIIVAMLAVIVVISVLVFGYPALLASNPQKPTSTPNPDIGGVAILNGWAEAKMVEDTWGQCPYRFHVYMPVEIKNPTAYDVTLRLYGKVDFTVTYDDAGIGNMQGNHILDNTVDITVPKYSQDTYQIPIFTGAAWCSDSNAVVATVNDHTISELWRGVGSAPQ